MVHCRQVRFSTLDPDIANHPTPQHRIEFGGNWRIILGCCTTQEILPDFAHIRSMQLWKPRIHWNSCLKVNFNEGNVKGELIDELTDRWFGSGFQLMSSSSFPKQLSVANKFTLLICNVQWMSPMICLYLSFTLICLFAAQVEVLTLSLTASAYCKTTVSLHAPCTALHSLLGKDWKTPTTVFDR